MKLKWLLPVSALTLATSVVPLVSCGNKNTLSWDFVKNGGYTSQITPKKHPDGYTQKDALKCYLTDVKQNPMILVDDLMLLDNELFWEKYVSYGEGIKTFKNDITINNVDLDNNLISFHYAFEEYIAEAALNPTHMEMKIDMTFTNIPFICFYELKHDLLGWWFIAGYLPFTGSAESLEQYFKSLSHSWSIKGTYHTNMKNINPNSKTLDVDVNIKNGSCNIDDNVTAALEFSLPMVGSSYFSHIPLKEDCELVYKNNQMELEQPIKANAFVPMAFKIDMSNWTGGGLPSSGMSFIVKQDESPDVNIGFNCLVDNTFLDYSNFTCIENKYITDDVQLTDQSKICLIINPLLSSETFNLYVNLLSKNFI